MGCSRVDLLVVDTEAFFLFTLDFFRFLGRLMVIQGWPEKKRRKNHQGSAWQFTELHVLVKLVVAFANTPKN